MKNDVTFIVPIFDLKEDRLNNLKFVLPHILKTGCKVVLAEQSETDSSNISNVVKEITKDYSNFVHVIYVHSSKSIHKTGIINWATKVHAKTKYVWVNDIDFYMKFEKALNEIWVEKFIKPYSVAKKLNETDSSKIINGESVNVDFSDTSVKYISLYSALSFIYEKEAFLEIGGMDASLFGWGKEDVEFNNRIIEKNITIQELSHRGIHLWHLPTEGSTQDTSNISDKDLAIITCHFNWCNYVSPVRNLNRFLYQMEAQQIPVYGVELSLDDNFVTSGRSNWKQIKVNKQNICFQKEACLNIAEKLVPSKYKKIAWIDSDLYFNNQNWYEDTSKKLDKYKLVQMFTDLIETDKKGNVSAMKKSTVSLGGPTTTGGWNGPPAGALAARRDLWKHGGLYPYSFLGSSDYIFINTVYDRPIGSLTKEVSSEKYKNWKKRIQSYISRKDISYVDGEIFHEWHGDKTERNYQGRNSITEKINYNTDICLNDNGILEIAKNKANIIEEIFTYFQNRNEDGISFSVTSGGRKNDMAVVCCFFNWAEYYSPQRNLQRFKWQMESKGIPFYGIELSLTDRFVSDGWKNWTRVKVYEKNVCFQKEAGINALEKLIPEEYTKIAWIDPDLNFSNENWYYDACKKLDENKVVQLFDKYIATDSKGIVCVNVPSIMANGGPSGKKTNGCHAGQPGAAWAARREMWLHGGLYPYSFMGGGDSAFVYTVAGNFDSENTMMLSGLPNKGNYPKYQDWKKTITQYVNNDVSFISGQVRHEWHGNHKKRGYDSRYEIIKDIHVEYCVSVGRNGLLQISNVDDAIYTKLMKYFKSRDEDNVS